MAYVAISQSLREDIRRIIQSKSMTERNLLDRPQTDMVLKPTDPLYTQFEAKMWGEHAALREQLPPEWCRNLASGRYHGSAEVSYLDDAGESKTRYVSVAMQVTFSPSIACPPNAETYNVGMRVDDANLDTYLAPIVQYENTTREITEKWNKVWDQVNGFLTNCKSLNQALKLWPDLRIYIPQPYLDKVNTVVERAKSNENAALEALKNVDTDAVVANAVMVRMLAASKVAEQR